MGRILVRGGHILSMDPRIGILEQGDILIEDGVIAQIAPSIPVTDAEIIDATDHIVAPGLIDTHRHTWQALLRGLATDMTTSEYLVRVRFGISRAYQPADIKLGNTLGALDALNGGVTTILDFSHSINTPGHADAAVEGLRDSGIRAVFGYGFFESSPDSPTYFPDVAGRVKDFNRVADTYFSSTDGPLRLGVSLTEPAGVPFSTTRAEIEAARSRDAVIVTHTGSMHSLPSGVRELDAGGLLGPDMVHVHCTALDDEEWTVIARTGGKVSIAVEPELNSGLGRPPFAACERHGIKPTLSCDSLCSTPGDLLSQLRFGLGFRRWENNEAANLAGKDPASLNITAEDALRWSTVNAAEAINLGDRIGSLSPGKQADLIIVGGAAVNQHPRINAAGTLLAHTTAAEVRHVLVGGKVVKRDGVLLSAQLPKLLDEADRATADLLARSDALPHELPKLLRNGFSAEQAMANLRDATPQHN